MAALGSLASGPALAAVPFAEMSIKGSPDSPLFASAYKDAAGGYGIAVLDEIGQILAQITLPGRGHGISVSQDGRCLAAFARRPGTFVVLAWPASVRPMQTLMAVPGRHFYGHGCFSADNRLLYAVENDYASARGVVGVYDVSGSVVKRLGEFDTYGIGPHEVLLDPHGRTLIVANGGIETHPDKGREKLNLATMAPSMVFLDAETGDLKALHRLHSSLHQLSLRHMALDASGRVWVGGQFEGPEQDTPPLVGVFSQDTDPVLTSLPDQLSGKLQNYIGSVTANSEGSVIATSAPRGGKTLFWSVATGRLAGYQDVPDGCGIAPIDQGSFLVSDGNGGLSYVEAPGERAEILARPPGFHWDNHMTALGKAGG